MKREREREREREKREREREREGGGWEREMSLLSTAKLNIMSHKFPKIKQAKTIQNTHTHKLKRSHISQLVSYIYKLL